MVSQSIFVFTFILRTCLIAAVFFNRWIDFTRDYPADMNGRYFLDTMFSL